MIIIIACTQDLNKMAAIVRKELPKLARLVLGALITLDVHGRDMITEMVKNGVSYRFVANVFVWRLHDTCLVQNRSERKNANANL